MEDPNATHKTLFAAARALHTLATLLTRPETERRTVEYLESQGWDRNRAIRIALELDDLVSKGAKEEWYLTDAAVTIKEAARQTGIKYSTLFAWVKHGMIRSHQARRSRRWFVHLEDVRRCKELEARKA